jgi:uncharacterized delta-60 repeat protein
LGSTANSGVAIHDKGDADRGFDAALQNDGRIIVAGYSDNGINRDIVVLRYNTDGSLDTGFGSGGVATYDSGKSDYGIAVTLQNDGRIIVVGRSNNGTNDDLVVLRYNADGSLDSYFGTSGVATYDSGNNDFGIAVTLQKDGRIIVGGGSNNGTNDDLVVLRYNADGSLDTGFGTNGVVIYDNGNGEYGNAVALQGDGRIIVAGQSNNGTDNDLVLLRYNTDGSLGTSFGTGGVAIYDSGNSDIGNAVTLQDDGRIIVAGQSNNGTDNDLVLLCFNADGSLDTGFGTNGVATYDSGSTDYGYAVALQEDGRIIVAGGYHNGRSFDVLTVRFLTEANNDPVAIDDTATTDEDTTVTISVLYNDTDADGDALILSDFDATSSNGGTITDGGGGDLIYLPTQDFNGSDDFNYTVSDGNGGTDTAMVTITVDSVNDPPVADAQSISVDKDTTDNAVTLTGSDADGDSPYLRCCQWSVSWQPQRHRTRSAVYPGCRLQWRRHVYHYCKRRQHGFGRSYGNHYS